MPVLAVPYLVPFANAAGIVIGSVATAVGLSALSDKVQDYMEENPENSMKILAMIMPEQGFAALFNEAAEGEGEEVEGEVEVEEKPKKLSGKEKGERIKAAIKRARGKKGLPARGNYSSPDAEGPAVDIRGSVIREVEDMGIADKDLRKQPYDKSKKYQGCKRFTRNTAHGGRIGFVDGGWADDLTGQGLALYNSMTAGGHSDQTIQDTLRELGYWGGDTSTTGIETITETAPNIGGGGGEASENTGFGLFGNLDKSTKKTVYRDIWSDELQTAIPQPIDIYQDSGNLWKTWEGGNPTHAGLDKVEPLIGNLMSNFLGIEDEGYQEGDIMGTYSDYNRHWSPNYKDLTFIQKWKADNQRNKELKDMQNKIEMRNAAIAAQAAAAKAQAENTAAGIGPITGHGQAIDPRDVRDIGGGFHEYRDSGTASSYEGSFKKGGLATMFQRRR